jgi:uncharacterized Zn-binding protein involved in type VI secretion
MPAVARIGDAEANHCSPPKRMQGVKSVFANGKPLSCVGHLNTPHKRPCGPKCCVHQAPLIGGSRTVFAEGRNLGRVGDKTCTMVIQGSPNVISA